MNGDDVQRIQWLTHRIDQWGRYHDHKETMAWVATAFYLAGIMYFAFTARRYIIDCCLATSLASIFIVVAGFLVLGFVCWQFGKRHIAAKNVERLNEALRQKVHADVEEKFDPVKIMNEAVLITYAAIVLVTGVALVVVLWP